MLGGVAHAFNLSASKAEAGGPQVGVSLIQIVSSGLASIYSGPCLKAKQKTKQSPKKWNVAQYEQLLRMGQGPRFAPGTTRKQKGPNKQYRIQHFDFYHLSYRLLLQKFSFLIAAEVQVSEHSQTFYTHIYIYTHKALHKKLAFFFYNII